MLARAWQRGRTALVVALRPWWLHVGIGVAIFTGLAVAAMVVAPRRGRPPGPEVVTWCEWFVAVAILPALMLPGVARRAEIRSWVLRKMGSGDDEEWESRYEYRQRQRRMLLHFCAMLWVWTGTTFALDLLLRAIAGLGWDPF